jgi:hypothetical protein
MTQDQSIYEEAMPVECAIARAGNEIMLCLEKREGRTPLKAVHLNGKEICWTCADGQIESPYMNGPTAAADMSDVIRDASAGELLVGEFTENETPEHWLMSPKG